ncbi:MFS transporter [Romeria aff. gracilis LEGE 07310]|uniref:MFS transporter n=1 Tax=Vasconcelosia minhoensis LEGE 07310 TaxID=915328 RepID=A0A8J7DQQ7_9CYAN|nr:MFS transporter [Romeria gracilis]MBE9076954.1 MFS transporter [Romeria aff. gracilis LEGE 07310]
MATNQPYQASLATLIVNQALAMSVVVLVVSMGGIVGYRLAPSPALATLPISAQVLGTFMMLFPASYLSNGLGRRRGFLIGSAIGVLGGLLAVYAIVQASFWLFCLSTLLLGFENAFAQYFRFSAVEIAPPERQSQAISLVLVGGIVAAFLGPGLARLTRDFWVVEFSAAGGAIALLCLLQGLLFFCFYRADAAPAIPAVAASGFSGSLLTRIPFLMAVLSGAVGYGTMTLIMNAAPLAIEQGAGLPFAAATSVIQWHIFAMYFPSFFTGRIIKAVGTVSVMLVGLLFLFACGFIALSGQSYAYFLSALVLLGLGWNFVYIGATDLLTKSVPADKKSFAQGLNDTLIYLCNTLGSLSSGILFARFGWQSLILLVLPILCLNFGLLLIFRAKLRPQAA